MQNSSVQNKAKKILPALGITTICLLSLDIVPNIVTLVQYGIDTESIIQIVRNVFIIVLFSIALIRNTKKK